MLYIPAGYELARPIGQGFALQLNCKGVSPQRRCPRQLNFAMISIGNNRLNGTRHKYEYAKQSVALLARIPLPLEVNVIRTCSLVEHLPEAFKPRGKKCAMDHNIFTVTCLNNEMRFFHAL